MKRATMLAGLVVVGLWLAGGFSPASAQVEGSKQLSDSPRHQEWVDIEAPGGRKVHTWVVYPEVDHPATTVIVIHENKGLTDWVRGVADQLAAAGYLALAPDFLSGAGPDGGGTDAYPSEDAATQGIYRLPGDQVMADVDAVVDYAKGLSASNKVIAVAGFCWGGGQTFAYACQNPNIAAAFVFYGTAPRDDASLAKIGAPVYGFYGSMDNRISGDVPRVESRMKKLQKGYEPIVYEGAGHGFMRQGEAATDPNDPNRRARDLAWQRWKNALSKLGKN
jgi:carboxymethylenebutenolidase